MIPNRDYGQPPPGGQIYPPEQAADMAAAAKARRIIAALDEYAAAYDRAAGSDCWPDVDGFRADARAVLHLHPELLAMLEGETE